jgi:hypothetical protein
MRAGLRRSALWALGLGVLLAPVLRPPPLRTGVYVQDVRGVSAALRKITAAPADLDLVLRDGAAERVGASRGKRRHEWLLGGLVPGRRYRWELRSPGGEAVLEAGSFATPPEGPEGDARPLDFAVVGDSGGLPPWIWLQNSPLVQAPARLGWLPSAGVVTAMGGQLAAANPAFVLHVGDVIYPKGQQQHYEMGFFRPFAEALRHAPVYVVLGNHDLMDADGRQALANFRLPRSETTGDSRCYSLVWGPVRVVVFDPGTGELGPVDADHPAIQHLDRELSSASEPWLIAASHYPIRSASRQSDRDDLVEHVEPLLRKYGVDLYFSGHDHTYQRYGDGRDGSVGPVQIVTGGGGKSLYSLREDPRLSFALSAYHWCRIRVEGRRLRLEAIGLDGVAFDRLELEKSGPGASGAPERAENPARSARTAALPLR